MMHIFLNALGASSASGLTYLRNVLPEFARRESIRTTVALNSRLYPEFAGLNRVSFADLPEIRGTAQRFWFEQARLPALVQKVQADILISAGNFALRNSPVPQILLSGNSLYISSDFNHDLLLRHEYRMWVDTRIKAALAKRSVHWADSTVAPTQAFADELLRWTGKTVIPIHHGFDSQAFFSDDAALPPDILSKLESAGKDLKLLYVSHYNYFRNFETLFRALPLIRKRLGRKVRLFLTCELQEGRNPGAYRTKPALSLVHQMGIQQEVIELGAIPYRQLHHVYRSCDLYVTASYAETFAHPLVEAMACGLPVVASDLPVHREVCGNAALYFPKFSPELLADRVLKAANSRAGERRSEAPKLKFSWSDHVDQIIGLADSLVRSAA